MLECLLSGNAVLVKWPKNLTACFQLLYCTSLIVKNSFDPSHLSCNYRSYILIVGNYFEKGGVIQFDPKVLHDVSTDILINIAVPTHWLGFQLRHLIFDSFHSIYKRTSYKYWQEKSISLDQGISPISPNHPNWLTIHSVKSFQCSGHPTPGKSTALSPTPGGHTIHNYINLGHCIPDIKIRLIKNSLKHTIWFAPTCPQRWSSAQLFSCCLRDYYLSHVTCHHVTMTHYWLSFCSQYHSIGTPASGMHDLDHEALH